MDGRKSETNVKDCITIKSGCKPKSDQQMSQITICEFLNFLKTAYQVQESVEGVLMEGGMTAAVNWLKSKESEFVNNGKNMSIQTSDSLIKKGCAVDDKKGSGDDKKDVQLKRRGSTSTAHDSDLLKRKLSEVLAEGLLDSVLPYLVQNSHSMKKCSSCSAVKTAEKNNSHSSVLSVCNDRLVRRKSSGDGSPLSKGTVTKTDSEVEIHVCDEVKNMKRTFVCNQKLLVEKMGYFAEVTLGQRLEDMDISVHCDIGIFEWLMQWVKKDSLLEADWPQLDSQCVIPILVSAAFLQMEPLLHDCLLFCHEHMNEILRSATNLSCLNDSVLTRLAAMYTNTEVELIKDRKDKIQSRLFSKLIQSLTEPDPESVRGHWCSLARIFRCERCQQLITPSVAANIPCIPSCMRLQPDGSIISLHTRDPNWNINDYVVKLQKTLKTWRKVYWRLWGDAHFLYCTLCKRFFPTNQIGWCRYHPDTPQFFTLDAQKAPLPIGRYSCCGERAYSMSKLDETGLSYEGFVKCVEEIVVASNIIMDGWQLNTKVGSENGKYITKKSIISLDDEAKTIVTFEYHVAYHISYGVPILCFNVWKQDGTMFTIEEYWNSNNALKDSNMYDTLTQMDHPVLCRPLLTLHPCKTHEIMQPFLEKSKNPVVSWLSVVGRFVHLEMFSDYIKYC